MNGDLISCHPKWPWFLLTLPETFSFLSWWEIWSLKFFREDFVFWQVRNRPNDQTTDLEGSDNPNEVRALFQEIAIIFVPQNSSLAGWFGFCMAGNVGVLGILKLQKFSRYQRLFPTWKLASLWEQRRLYKENGWKPFEQWPVDNACVRFRGCGKTIQLYGDYIISQWIKSNRL